MNYYKTLDLDFEIPRKKILTFVRDRKDKITSFWTNLNSQKFFEEIPEIFDLFKPLNITPTRAAIITAVQNVGIHRDDTNKPIRINVPIYNTKGSKTLFWKSNASIKREFLDNGVPYLPLSEDDCTLADQLELIKPAVLRITEPHSVVVNPAAIPRIVCTFEFKEDIEFLLED
jgi:hypothetical protein